MTGTLNEQAKGVYAICVTPFTDSETVDLESTRSMIDFYLEKGCSGLTLLGIMGEAPKLTAEEARLFVKTAVEATAGRVPLVVGVSSGGLASLRELALDVMALGVAGVMVAPPGHLRSDDQIYGYYESVAEALGPSIPFVLQDYPLITGVQIPVQVIARLIDAIPTCVMVKHEDWPGLNKISALRKREADHDLRRVSILVGNGGLFLPDELTRGADGAMTGFAYPEMMVDVVAAHSRGEVALAHDIFDAYLPLARYEQQPGIGLAVRKHILAQRGAITSPAMRKPRQLLNAFDLKDIAFLVDRQARYLERID
ncbi:4-hydroxy-tetrahydrodipicolinate synthase [Aminobacter lissarensis]|uniref:4-hydroxy-tetrahydrodipicolinate synthase n=1 Tax=Aminobacter carboxidus TaxID=376165 RepID=A0A8E1WJ83_9HYPH|nr:dihydrodipicolinate synthase family protein [Aminobacter lissarensis]MBB6470056.1 4-hydroxy-tetrahydrodipicolinate synthase [Aminobacter lissarensis]